MNIKFTDIKKEDYKKTPNHILINDEKLEFRNIDFKNLTISHKSFVDNNNSIVIDTLSSKIKNIFFLECTFENKLEVNSYLKYELNFSDCNINNLNFNSLSLDENNIKNISFENNKIKSIKIDKCNFNGRFTMYTEKQLTIEHIDIRDSTFESFFEMGDYDIKGIVILQVNFENDTFFSDLKFIDDYLFLFSRINFNGLVDFNGCIFEFITMFDKINFNNRTNFENNVFKDDLELKYVNFKELVIFKKVEFLNGLDLDLTSFEKEIKLYDVKGLGNVKNSTQETYRIIKYIYQQYNNQIEANKYHMLELEKRREELNNYMIKKFDTTFAYSYDTKEYKGSLTDWIIFNFNWYSSKFGTRWSSALYWIFAVSFFTMYSIYSCNFEYILNSPSIFFEKFFKYMSIIHYEELKEHPITFFLNKVSLGYLYYQFITAVRKDTRK